MVNLLKYIIVFSNLSVSVASFGIGSACCLYRSQMKSFVHSVI